MPNVRPYLTLLATWMPGADTRAAEGAPARAGFDALLTWRGPRGRIRYLLEEKRHLQNQDVRVVIDQLERWRRQLAADERRARLLLLAPAVRPQQAAILQDAGVDYIDLAGNAHLTAPGMVVHVEGRGRVKERLARQGRPNKGWVKTVLTLLIRPELVGRPYRKTAEHAQVALGTVAGCVGDLAARGLLHEGRNGRRLLDRQQLLPLAVQAYVDVLRPRLEVTRLQVRAETKQGIWARVGAVLGARRVPWALTGADAAEQRTHFFRAEETEIYAPVGVFQDRDILKALVAQPAARAGNLLVVEPPIPAALVPLGAGDLLPVTPALMAYAELRYRGTAQALEAAEILLPTVMDSGQH
jgi:hypothetical protein